MPNDPQFLTLTTDQIRLERKLVEADQIIEGYRERGSLKNITVDGLMSMLKRDISGEHEHAADEQEIMEELQNYQSSYFNNPENKEKLAKFFSQPDQPTQPEQPDQLDNAIDTEPILDYHDESQWVE